MAVPDRTGIPEDTQLHEQYVLNRTFDPDFNIMAVELVAWDPAANVMRRLEVVESTLKPGHYVLAVGNSDGSPISGGSGGGTTAGTYGSAIYGTSTYA